MKVEVIYVHRKRKLSMRKRGDLWMRRVIREHLRERDRKGSKLASVAFRN